MNSAVHFDSFEEARARFRWAARWELFSGTPTEFNLGYECIDRHIAAGRGWEVAARTVSPDGVEQHTYDELLPGVRAVTAAIRELGVASRPVAVVLDPSRHYYECLLGVLRAGSPVIPCSPVLGLDTLAERLTEAGARLAVVGGEYDIGSLRDAVGDSCRILESESLMAPVHPVSDSADLADANRAAMYCYTSGTTGRQKRVILSHRAFTTLAVSVGLFVMGLSESDRYLSTYSSGWLAGAAWGALVPMSLGTAAGLYRGHFDPDTFLSALEEIGISAMHCPPTVYRRAIHAAGERRFSVPKIGYTAEALSARDSKAVAEIFGSVPRSQYGATEIGLVAVDYSYPDYQVRHGSLGKSLLGVDVVVVDEEGVALPTGEVGRLAVRRNGSIRFAGDLGHIDDDGYLWFDGRADDLIITAGYTVSPQQVEDILRQHPAVSEVGVTGVPDADRGHRVAAYVQLRPGFAESVSLAAEIQEFARARGGRYLYPRGLTFVDDFPRTESGKIIRRALAPSSAAQDGNAG